MTADDERAHRFSIPAQAPDGSRVLTMGTPKWAVRLGMFLVLAGVIALIAVAARNGI